MGELDRCKVRKGKDHEFEDSSTDHSVGPGRAFDKYIISILNSKDDAGVKVKCRFDPGRQRLGIQPLRSTHFKWGER